MLKCILKNVQKNQVATSVELAQQRVDANPYKCIVRTFEQEGQQKLFYKTCQGHTEV